MQNLGEKLRSAREEKGVSDSEAAQATRIKVQHIRALENEDFDQMPAPIYVKGFIKLYAEYLGVDVEEMVQMYASSHSPLSPREIVGDRKDQPKRDRRERTSRSASGSEADSQTAGPEEGRGARTPRASGRQIGDLLGGAIARLRRGLASLGGLAIPWRRVLTVAGALVVLVLIISSLRNCFSGKANDGGKSSPESLEVIEGVPEPYLDIEKTSVD